jgi:hypothetical protein
MEISEMGSFGNFLFFSGIEGQEIIRKAGGHERKHLVELPIPNS